MPSTVFFFDLDGTILDVSDKFYKTYCDLLTKQNNRILDKFTYWELKRNATPEIEIQAITNASFSDFSIRRKEVIETDYYQALDVLQPLAKQTLQHIKSIGSVYIVTLRHSHDQVLKQLKRLDILHFFDGVLSSGETTSPNWKIKHNLIHNYFSGKTPTGSVFVGDTETDILAGKAIGSKTVAVLSGMRNYEKVKQHKPDFIIPSIGDMLHLNIL